MKASSRQTAAITVVGKSWTPRARRLASRSPKPQDDRRLSRFSRNHAPKSSTTPNTSSTDSSATRLCPPVAPGRASSGAAWIVLCDTNGGALLKSRQAIDAVRAEVSIPLGIHTTTTASSPLQCLTPSTMVPARSGTINGLGERCGNATSAASSHSHSNTLTIRLLPAVSKSSLIIAYVYETANMNSAQPGFVGSSAFATRRHARPRVRKNAISYEHVEPPRSQRTPRPGE